MSAPAVPSPSARLAFALAALDDIPRPPTTDEQHAAIAAARSEVVVAARRVLAELEHAGMAWAPVADDVAA